MRFRIICEPAPFVNCCQWNLSAMFTHSYSNIHSLTVYSHIIYPLHIHATWKQDAVVELDSPICARVWELECGWRLLLQVWPPSWASLMPNTQHKQKFVPTLTLLATCQTAQESRAPGSRPAAVPALAFSPPILSEVLMGFSELTAALSVTGWPKRGKRTPNVRAFVEYGESSGICL